MKISGPPASANFDPAFIDFDHGIRVGNLHPSQRITQIIKGSLTARHGIEMTCDRWGRGVFWQWICWVPRPNRDAKPLSSSHNFASAKFFISVDQEEREFSAGMQIERASLMPSRDSFGVSLKKDWDWNVMLHALKGEQLPKAIKRLLKDGFRLRVGPFSSLFEYKSKNWNPLHCLNRLRKFPGGEWGMFQLSYSMRESEVRKASGGELVEAMLNIFDEVTGAMNLCMYAPCLTEEKDGN